MLQRNIQLSIVIACSLLVLSATDIILPSLPHISHFFSVPANDVKMLLSIYMLGEFTTVLFWGVVADQIGRRQTLLLGMLLFLLGSVLSVLAHSINTLLLARFLQGTGAIVVPVAGWALIQDLFPKDEGARILAWVGTLTAILPLLAPALGGHLDALYGWRSNLYCIAIYSFILSIILIITPSPRHTPPGTHIKTSQRFAVYYPILRHKTFISYIAIFGLLNSGAWCFLTVAPFYYAHQHIPANSVGILLMCTSMGFVFGSLLTAKLFKWFGIDNTIKLGIQLSLIASLILLTGEWMHWNEYPLFSALNMGLYIASSALLWSGTTSRALQCFTECRGAASAVRSLILLCFSFFGTCFGKLMPHESLFSVGLFLFLTSLTALLVFHNKDLKAERLTSGAAI